MLARAGWCEVSREVSSTGSAADEGVQGEILTLTLTLTPTLTLALALALARCVSGLLVAKELDAFSQVLDADKVQRPLTAIVGGAKIKDKILVLENLIDQASA